MGKVLGVGVDLVDLGRFTRLHRRYGGSLRKLAFHDHEVTVVGGDPAKLAALYAVKECVAKALGVGLHYMSEEGISPRDVEARTVVDGRACIVLHGRAGAISERVGIRQWDISYSICGPYALAQAIASGDRGSSGTV